MVSAVVRTNEGKTNIICMISELTLSPNNLEEAESKAEVTIYNRRKQLL